MTARQLLASIAVLGAVLAPAVIGAEAASNQGATIPVSRSTWFWQKSADSVPGGGALGDQEPSNVPQGDLVVATDAQGNPTKASYVAFDASRLNASALVSVKIKVPVDTTANRMYATPPSLAACRPRTTWAAGSGAAWSAKPQDDCTKAAAGVFDATNNIYAFDVSGLVQSAAAAGDLGVAILPAPGASGQPGGAPYQVDFQAPAKIEVAVTYAPTQAAPEANTASGPETSQAPGPAAADPGALIAAPLLPVADPGLPAVVPPAASATNAPTTPAGRAVAARTQPSAITIAPLPSNALVQLLFITGAAAFGALAWFLADDSPDPAELLERRRLMRSALAERRPAP